MHLANNPVSSQRSRHINVRYHFIRETIANGEITLKFVGTADQWADILTKALALPQFKFLVKQIYGLSLWLVVIILFVTGTIYIFCS